MSAFLSTALRTICQSRVSVGEWPAFHARGLSRSIEAVCLSHCLSRSSRSIYLKFGPKFCRKRSLYIPVKPLNASFPRRAHACWGRCVVVNHPSSPSCLHAKTPQGRAPPPDSLCCCLPFPQSSLRGIQPGIFVRSRRAGALVTKLAEIGSAPAHAKPHRVDAGSAAKVCGEAASKGGFFLEQGERANAGSSKEG